MNSQLWWYTARAGGLVGWALLAASVLWGLALSTKAFGPKPRPNWMLDLHRFLGGAAVVFTVIHVLAIVLDSYVHFGLSEVLVPLASHWHPVAVAWGIVGAYLLAAVEVTSLLRKRLSKRAWRMTHFLSFPLYVVGTIHMISAGTDGTSSPVLFAAIASSVFIVALTVDRIRRAVADRVAGPGAPRVPQRVQLPITAAAAPPEPSRVPVHTVSH
ncbi:MAG TPA: ferric reductase-like transmembrane domain-containing protein [Acidimicrobiales bacterium]